MNAFQLQQAATKPIHEGHGSQELVAYIEGEGDPLELLSLDYDPLNDEVALTVDY